ncbi:hypothetical protein [Pasteuria penetrans]|uniref:hypothetical protein n=1 Tax=Pasteuria penetrans TaxID=86005 RepID=UPI000FB0D764|nr:hypothetical protein [Pasteuria penetrans]
MNQQQCQEYFRLVWEKGCLAHAYALFGPAESGKRAVALYLAQMLFCTQRRGGKACRRCRDCQLCERERHPRMRIWEGVDSIKIGEVRDFLQQSSRDGGPDPHVWIVGAAERCTTQAANALLRFLEEPMGVWYILLLSDRPWALLPTLRSRCQMVFLTPPSPAVRVAGWVKGGMGKIQAEVVVQLSTQGGASVQKWPYEKFAQCSIGVIQWAEETLVTGRMGPLGAQVMWEGERPDVVGKVDLCIAWAREGLCRMVDREMSVVPGLWSEFPPSGSLRSISEQRWLRFLRNLLVARGRLMNPSLHPRGILERFALDMLSTGDQ